MAANTDQKAKLFDLQTTVSELVRDGNRDPEQVADVLQVIKERKDFANVLMKGSSKKFIVREKFVVDTSHEAPAQIGYLGDNFQNWFLNAVEEIVSPAKLGFFVLERAMFDKDIVAKIGGVLKAVTSLADVYSKMEQQPRGPKSPAGDLLTNSFANIFYVPQAVKRLDSNRFSYVNLAGREVIEEVADSQYLFEIGGRCFFLRVVDVDWDDWFGAWYVSAYGAEYPRSWHGGYQVFSRNC